MGNESSGSCCCEREKSKARNGVYVIKQFDEDMINSSQFLNAQSTGAESKEMSKKTKKKKKKKSYSSAQQLNDSLEVKIDTCKVEEKASVETAYFNNYRVGSSKMPQNIASTVNFSVRPRVLMGSQKSTSVLSEPIYPESRIDFSEDSDLHNSIRHHPSTGIKNSPQSFRPTPANDPENMKNQQNLFSFASDIQSTSQKSHVTFSPEKQSRASQGSRIIDIDSQRLEDLHPIIREVLQQGVMKKRVQQFKEKSPELKVKQQTQVNSYMANRDKEQRKTIHTQPIERQTIMEELNETSGSKIDKISENLEENQNQETSKFKLPSEGSIAFSYRSNAYSVESAPEKNIESSLDKQVLDQDLKMNTINTKSSNDQKIKQQSQTQVMFDI